MPPATDESELHRWQQELIAERLAIYKQDLCNWFNRVLNLEADPSAFVEALGPGVLLLDLALAIQEGETSWQQRQSSGVTFPTPKLRVRRAAKSGTFEARDNVSQFIVWARCLGIPDDLMFETNDLVMEKDIKQVAYCLMEVARCQLGVEPPRLVKMERSLEEGSLSSARAMDVDALDSAVRALLAEFQMDECLADERDDHDRYFFGQERPVFVRLLDGDLLVPMEGDWITLRHYLRLISGDYQNEVNRVLRRCRTVAKHPSLSKTMHDTEEGDTDNQALEEELLERIETRENQFSEQLTSLTRGLQTEQEQGKMLEQRVDELQRERKDDDAFLEKAQDEIRTLRKRIARERFARASQFALANVRKRESNIATLQTAALTLQRWAKATKKVFDSKEQVVAPPPVTSPAMVGNSRTEKDTCSAAKEADDAVVCAEPETVVGEEKEEEKEQQQQQQQQQQGREMSSEGPQVQSMSAQQRDHTADDCDQETMLMTMNSAPALSLHEQRCGAPPQPLLIPTGDVDDSFLFDDPSPHQPTPPRHSTTPPRRHSMLPRLRISNHSVEDSYEVQLQSPRKPVGGRMGRPALVRSPAQHEAAAHASASPWGSRQTSSYGSASQNVRSRSSPHLVGSHARLTSRHDASHSQQYHDRRCHHTVPQSAPARSPSHERLQGLGEDAVVTTRDGRCFRVVGVKEIKTVERRLTSKDGRSGPAFQTQTTTRRLNAAEVANLDLLPKARRLHAGMHSSQVAARGDEVQYAPTPRVSIHTATRPERRLFDEHYRQQQQKRHNSRLPVNA